ncbi:hypothetical protein [Sphingomonas oleivorans]|nr:hypothetical protein [Sphingomonas oleivorans]
MGEAAAADMPAAIGYMILAVYGLMMAALVAFFTDGVEATMMVAISVIYTAIYFSVPSSFLRVEGRSGQMPLREFLRDGLSTWTGRIGGCEAILQILLIPAAITVALAAIGLLARLNQA